MKELHTLHGSAHDPSCRQATTLPAGRRRLAVRVALMAMAGLSLPVAAAEPVLGSTVALAPGYTRIELESAHALPYVLHPTGDGARVLLELSGTDGGPGLDELDGKLGRDNPFLSAVQLRQPGPDTTVVEFDLRGRVQARATPLAPANGRGYRLVLDFYPGTAANRFSDTDAGPANGPGGAETWLAVQVNRQAPPVTALFLITADHRLSARRADLEQWRLRVPADAVFRHQGEDYVPLAALDGLSSRLDLTNQTLELTAPARLFSHSDIAASALRPKPAMPTTLGAFFNYDVVADRSDSDSAGPRVNGFFEAGTYDGFGVITTSALRRDLGTRTDTLRLDSTWTLDRPAKMASLRVGDAISRAASWGGAVRFGGLQWSTNFATQPGFVTMPLPGLSGEAVLPSTVDLYVNDIRRLHQDVAPGPFTLQDAPVITGQGEARLVVRDLLGREQVTTQAFYASPRLLRRGLQDFSYELGTARENYGLASNDYGRTLAVGTHRYGFSDRFTGEAHAEVLAGQQTAGLGGAFLLPAVGVLSGAVAGSHSDAGNGGLAALGLEHQGRRFNFGVNSQVADARFTYLGLAPGMPAPRQRSRAYVSLASAGHGSASLAYSVEDRRDQPALELLNASYSMSLLQRASLSLYALHSLGAVRDTTVGLTFTLPLDGRRNLSAGGSHHAGASQGYVELQQGLPAGSGVGYRLRAGLDDNGGNGLASVSAQTGVGTYTLEAAHTPQQDGLRAGASGGVVLVRDGLFLSRRLTDSFAVVHVPGFANVRVYADNQLVAHTDANGDALLPRLRPYQKNPVRIEADDLPLDASVGSISIDAVPAWRSGLSLEFPVRRSRGVTLHLLGDDGQPVPAGAVARLASNEASFPVGRQGLLYLTDPAPQSQVAVTWPGGRCGFALAVPASSDPLPDLGTHTCRGDSP